MTFRIKSYQIIRTATLRDVLFSPVALPRSAMRVLTFGPGSQRFNYLLILGASLDRPARSFCGRIQMASWRRVSDFETYSKWNCLRL